MILRLNQRIIIQSVTEKQNNQGAIITNWHDHQKVWANALAIGNQQPTNLEFFKYMQIIYSNPFLFTIRYLREINFSMRIIYKNDIFNIKRIINYKEQDIYSQIITQQEV